MDLHADELNVDAVLVRRLVAQSFPDLADLAIEPVSDSGSSNSLYRLGEALVARLPRQPGGGNSIIKEAAWLPYVGPRLTVDVPYLVGLGTPGFGYTETWAVTSWLHGNVPRARLHGAKSVALAHDLALLIAELRAMPVPAHAVEDPALSTYRGDSLTDLDDDFREVVDECRALDLDLDLDEALRVWDAATAASGSLPQTVHWYHGDLLAENVLLNDQGQLAAVLDLGGLGLGNPTVDLVIAWELLDSEGREAFRRSLVIDDAQWAESRGWALLLSLITFPYYGLSMPKRCAARLALAKVALADN